MVNKFLYGIFIAVTAVLVLGVLFTLFRDPLMRLALAPDLDFAETEQPPAPDYADPASWAAHPARPGYAEKVPASLAPPPPVETRKADVFFVHPTTYIRGGLWNGPIDDDTAALLVDQAVMKNQAAVFNGCCRIFAPRYRQATFYYSLANDDNAFAALDLAFGDVKAAFDYYMANDNRGRPFILASHSQGTRHAMRLLEDVIANSPAQKQMIAAYLVGIAIPEDKDLGGVKPCDSPAQTGCFTAWTTLGLEAETDRYHNMTIRHETGYAANTGKALHCTNPISWTNHASPTALKDHKGAVPTDRTEADLRAPFPAQISAACQNGVLRISPPEEDDLSSSDILGYDDYHLEDYNLFFINIRDNAAMRVQAFLDRR